MNECELTKAESSKKHNLVILFTILASLNFLTAVCEEYFYLQYIKQYSESDVTGEWAAVTWDVSFKSLLKSFVSLIPAVAAVFISRKVEKTENKNQLKNIKLFVLNYVFLDLGLSVIIFIEDVLKFPLFHYLTQHWIFEIFYEHDWLEEILMLICRIHEPQVPAYYILEVILHEAYAVIFFILNFILIKKINKKINDGLCIENKEEPAAEINL